MQLCDQLLSGNPQHICCPFLSPLLATGAVCLQCMVQDDITRKGVVFNEMKGVYSSPDSVNMRTVQHALFPDNTYGEDSGGDPKVIPVLTFEEFQVFPADLPCCAELCSWPVEASFSCLTS